MENKICKSFNEHFSYNDIKAYAFRRRQSKFTQQVMDVLVDSGNREYYLAVECKSIKESSVNKIYFSQHFSEEQIERETEFIDKTGRNGFLVVELRRGRGRKRKAYAVPWKIVLHRYEDGGKGFELDELPNFIELERSGDGYCVEDMFSGGYE